MAQFINPQDHKLSVKQHKIDHNSVIQYIKNVKILYFILFLLLFSFLFWQLKLSNRASLHCEESLKQAEALPKSNTDTKLYLDCFYSKISSFLFPANFIRTKKSNKVLYFCQKIF